MASDLLERSGTRDQLQGVKVNEAERSAFLDLIAAGGTITSAAAALNRSRAVFHALLNAEPAFAAAFERAYEASADLLEQEAWRRATQPDKHGRYSDRLLEMLLRARRPWRYRNASSVELTGAGGGPVQAVVASVDPRAVLEVLAAAGLVAPALPVIDLPASRQEARIPRS